MRRGDASRPRHRHGAALLEVMVALTLLATAGAATAKAVMEATETVRLARAREAEMRAANAYMHVVALWPREDLDRRLGTHRQGDWRLGIDRPARALYQVTLRDSLDRLLLQTALFRAEHAAPGEAHASP